MRIGNLTDYRALAPRTALIASLGFASLLGAIAVATWVTDGAPAKNGAVPEPSAESAAMARSPRHFGHHRSVSWQAEARSYISLIRYLLEPEFQANPSGGSPSVRLPAPTNFVSTPVRMRGDS